MHEPGLLHLGVIYCYNVVKRNKTKGQGDRYER